MSTGVGEENNAPKDFWGRVRSEVSYESPSDAKLASLYLENAKTFPIDLLSKFFDIILDPSFKLEDVSFKTHRDVFQYVSDYRAKLAATTAGKESPTPASKILENYSLTMILYENASSEIVLLIQGNIYMKQIFHGDYSFIAEMQGK